MDKNLIVFKNSHKNIINILLHIICGCLYISLISCCFINYYHCAILLYSSFVYYLTSDIMLTLVIYGILYCITNKIIQNKLPTLTLLGLAFAFYMLPEMGHILCDETTVLSTENFNLNEIIINIFVLLPYSILSLVDNMLYD